MMTEAPKREHWIDCLKAICIICVYIAHCESFYYVGRNFASFIVGPFYVNTFFFISGYLLMNKQFKNNRIKRYTLSREYKEDIMNTIFKIMIPTIIFSAIIYLPKNEGSFNLHHFLYNVLGGTSLWFTSALAVSQLVIFTLLLSRRTNIWFYIVCTFILFITTTSLGDIRSKPAIEYFPWYWQTGFIYTFIIMLGGVYRKYKDKINSIINKPYVIFISFILFTTIIIYGLNGGTVLFIGLSGKCNILGILAFLLSLPILLYTAKKIPENRLTSFIGKQSIVFYFLSGAVPSILLPCVKRIPFTGSYIIITIYTLLAITISSIATYVIVKYVPKVLDLRNK